MLYPVTCVDNFFREPEKIINFANQIMYVEEPDAVYPGVRSLPVHEVDANFFNWCCKKILSIFYPFDANLLSFSANMTFQKVPANLKNDGWIHTDSPGELTVIIYLSRYVNSGTSFYTPKNSYGITKFEKEKYEYFQGKRDDVSRELNVNNSFFEEDISINSKFNRLLAFDSSVFHAAHPYLSDSDDAEDRLTLITGFSSIGLKNGNQLKYPLVEMNRL